MYFGTAASRGNGTTLVLIGISLSYLLTLRYLTLRLSLLQDHS